MATALERYNTSNISHFMRGGNTWAEYGDRALGIGYHTALLAERVATTATAPNCAAAADACSSAGGLLGASRIIFPIENLFSGRMFWQTDADGHFVRDARGNKQLRNLFYIALDILVLAARTLSTINWFGSRGVFDLKEHSKAMCDAIMGLWITVCALDCIDNIRQMRVEQDPAKRWKLGANITTDLLDIAALPFDFGYGMSGSAELAIVGSVLNIGAKTTVLIKEALYYG